MSRTPAGRATMDFFGAQAHAHARTRLLLLAYFAALVAVAAAMALAAGVLYTPVAMYGALPLRSGVTLDHSRMIGTFVNVLLHGVPLPVYAWTAGVTVAVMVLASLKRWFELRAGGEAVADLMRANPVDRGNATATQTRLLNVVEEMAIAAGIRVPRVYVLPGERGINALAAGYGPNEAVVIVTEGAFATLSRDELQAVMAHEYSHILNGDMRLNVRLMALMHGVDFIGATGSGMVREAVSGAVGVEREKQRLNVVLLFFGAILAFVGSSGLFCARLIKAAIARQREHLADASAVRFTRHGESVAGALDTIIATRRGSIVWNPHAEDVSHMFYAQAVSTWLGHLFATHPYIEDRIRAVDPGFRRTEYRRRRGTDLSPGDRAVAVLDGSGTVVKVHEPLDGRARTREAEPGAAIASTVGRPTAEHIDHARLLLARIPGGLRERLEVAERAAQVLCALALSADIPTRICELAALSSRKGESAAAETRDAYALIAPLGRAYSLLLAELALGPLKALKQPARDAFLADHLAIVEADGRVTLREFVLHAFLRQRLREDAGRAVGSVYKSVSEVKAEAHAVLSIVAHACGGERSADAFAAGLPWLGVALQSAMPTAELSTRRIGEALERLRVLQALEKPRIVRACIEAASQDGRIRIAEAELVRLVAATLDCPLPPVLAALDPAKLQA